MSAKRSTPPRTLAEKRLPPPTLPPPTLPSPEDAPGERCGELGPEPSGLAGDAEHTRTSPQMH
jgi:hypothetical protein